MDGGRRRWTLSRLYRHDAEHICRPFMGDTIQIPVPRMPFLDKANRFTQTNTFPRVNTDTISNSTASKAIVILDSLYLTLSSITNPAIYTKGYIEQHLTAGGGYGNYYYMHTNNIGSGVLLTLLKSGNTASSPVSLGANSQIGNIDFGGYDSSVYYVSAYIQAKTTEQWGAFNGKHGTQLILSTSANNNGGSGTYIFDQDGSFTVPTNITAGGTLNIGGALGVTGLSTLTGGLTVPANASRNIALNDTVSITGQLNVGTSGTAQSHYIYAGVDTTFIGSLSSQYLALFGNGSNNNLLSKGATFNIGTSDVQDVYLYRNNTPMVELTSTGFVGKTPFNQTFAWQEDSLGREGRGGLVSSTRQIYWQNVGNFPKILEAVSGTGVSRFLFDSSGNETIGGYIKSINGFTFEGNGAIGTPDTISWTAQTASISSKSFSNTSTGHLYRFTYYVSTTTTSTSGGTISISTAWNDGVSQTFTSGTALLSATGVTGMIGGTEEMYVASGVPTWSTTVSGAIIGSPQYQIRAALEMIW